jgi:trehalose 6-phosphate phosphatase
MAKLPAPADDLLDGASLFLDFDGTLVDLAETPDSIRVSPSLEPMLERLRQRLEGRLAIVSGRSLADLESHLPKSRIAFSGSHGLELRLAGGMALPLRIPSGLNDALEKVRELADGTQGLLVEAKPAGIALHYRQVPAAAERVESLMAGLALRHGFGLQRGKMVVELVPLGATKGDALRAFMADPGFAGTRPVFVGDDLTDEHGFAAAVALGGAGVLVGPERESEARYRLPSVGAVADWLESAA